MRMKTTHLSALTAILLMSGPARAQQESQTTSEKPLPVTREKENGPVRVSLHLDRDAVAIPQTAILTISVQAERGVEVEWPKIDETLADFAIEKVEKSPSTTDDMYVRTEWAVSLAPLAPGELQIRALTFSFRDARPRADGSEGLVEDSLVTPSIPVKVTQVLADVKDPATLYAPTSFTLLYWLLGAVGVMVLIGLLARYFNRRPARKLPPPPTPAHIWALSQLDILASEGLIERGRVQEWYYRINAILRQYIERRFGLMAGEQTSEEFVRELQRSGLLNPDQKDRLRRFIDACDPVKYARHRPDTPEIDWVQATAREFVLETAAAPTQSMQEAAT